MTELRLTDFQVIINSSPICVPMSLTLGMGNFFAIVGNNGSGKTSLFNALLDELPFKGSKSSLPAPVFYLRQHQHLAFDLSVEDILVSALHQHTKYHRYEQKLAAATTLLNDWGLLHLLHQTYFTLSGGQRQLIWILQALIGEPKTLLLDEPTQYLDIKNTRLFYDKLFAYAQEKQSLVLCICHEIEKLSGRKGYLLNIENEVISPEAISDSSIEQNIAKLS